MITEFATHDRDHNGNYGDGYNGPRGSYVQTCQNIQVKWEHASGQAAQKKKNGKDEKIPACTISRVCRDIENDNGKLRCR